MAADKAQLPRRSRAQVLCGIFQTLNVSQWVEWGGSRKRTRQGVVTWTQRMGVWLVSLIALDEKNKLGQTIRF